MSVSFAFWFEEVAACKDASSRTLCEEVVEDEDDDDELSDNVTSSNELA